jgi:predicted O-linked N-acetylglucosamine transferase (SPINDLY family)/GT2 family glycosyltransferase/Tfp pilus assembly protein PilF
LQTLRQGLAHDPSSVELLLAEGWLHHDLQEHALAADLAERASKHDPQSARAWHLLGASRLALGDYTAATGNLGQALRLDATNVDAEIQMAMALRHTQQFEQAESVLATAVSYAPENTTLLALQVQVWLDLEQTDVARRQVHRLIAREPDNGNLWFLLAQSLKQLQRHKSAARAVQRALRLEPGHAEAWKFSVWLALDDHHRADARSCAKHWLDLSPDTQETDIQAAFLLTACGDLMQASAHAETAVARDTQSADAWHALGHVRHSQQRLDEAETCLRHALSRSPQPPVQTLRKLGWVLRSAGRLSEAAPLFLQATEVAPSHALCAQEYADVLLLCGDLDSAKDALARTLILHPECPPLQLLHAKLMVARGAPQWPAATDICCTLIRRRACVPEASQVLMDLAAQGSDAAQRALQLLPRAQRRKAYRKALEQAQARSGHAVFCKLAQLASQDFPDDLRIATTDLCAAGLRTDMSPQELARRIRSWQRRLILEAGPETPSRNTPHLPATPRLRIAYVAAHFHHALMLGVLAAHDTRVVDVFLYCDIAPESLGELAGSVRLHPLRDQDLVASMHANRIDVAIDTVGIGGLLGQHQVLQQFAHRVAPVQCAWLGNWASGGGVYDCVFTDAHALPASAEHLYDEAVIRLDGGQWAWKPPLTSPPVAPPPSQTRQRITLSCPVRAFRISASTMHAWARLLAQLPQADLVLMGEHAGNAPFRRELDDALAAVGVNPDRIRFQAQRPYADYLSGYADIDIVLDTFPANGGLCLLDALWMGVPVVSLAGQWMGERQGLSILSAMGHLAWVAADEAHYRSIVCALANQPQTLVALRSRLRDEMAVSPLLDAKRIARAIETHCLQLKQQAIDVAQAPTTKERARAVARRQLQTWLSQPQRLLLAQPTLSPQGAVDVSVVIVLFNQAGLSRQAFAALADQTGVAFETIIVDNASSDETGALLERLDGATVIRNTDNVGFLRAANQGAAVARGRHIVFLNNDAMLHDHALRQGVCRLDCDVGIGAVGGRIVLADGRLQEAGCIAYRNGSTSGYGRGEDPRKSEFCCVRDVDFCSGAFLMVRTELWQQLGGFDPVFAPAYYEDTDLCLRIQDAGYRVVYDPSIWLTHFEWGSSVSSQDAVALMEGRRARFATRHQQRLSQRPEPQQAQPHRDRWLVHADKPRVLLIDNAVPHMAAGGGLPRARLMVQALADHHLTVFPLWDCDDDWSDVYASIPETVEVMLGVGAAGLERFLEQRAGVYDVLVVSRPPNMAFVETLWNKRPALFNGMRLVYDAEAIFALRDIGQAAVRGQPLPLEKARQLLDDELALVRRADTVLSVSAIEADMFRAAGALDVRLLSHAMETRPQSPGWDDRRGLLFVGAIHPNTPNEDSLLWFCEHVTHLLRGLGAELITISIVGDCTSDKVARLASEHIRLVGRVDDLTPWYDSHRVFIAPTRFGAGVPAKVIEAACNGIPVVATPLLVRQLGWQDGVEIASGDTAEAFAGAVALLHGEPQVWSRLCQAMAARTRALYAPQQFAATLASVILPHGN